MARMIPATFSFQSESKAEERLYYKLRDSLDDTHIIFHSFDIFKRNPDSRRICGTPRHFSRATRHASAVIARRENMYKQLLVTES
jgi:hypothetical protein